MMKSLPISLALSAIGLALILAAPAEAAKKRSHYQSGVAAHGMAPGGSTGRFQGGVLAGPLYNGQDYLGDDPDPNIRSYLLRDLSGRYGGGR
jgi:hypothetical protein